MTDDKLYKQCLKKKRYSTFRLAKKVAKISLDKRGAELRIYKCDICNGFHLTSLNLEE